MKAAWKILMAMSLMAGSRAAGNDLGAFEGNYSGPASVTAAIVAGGTATVKVVTPSRGENRGAVEIDGTVYSNGKAVPLRTRLSFRDGRVKAESFLLGLQGVPVGTKTTEIMGAGTTIRFRLQAAAGATFNGLPVSGAMIYSLVLEDGQLLINGHGRVKNGDGIPQQVVIAIVATKVP